MPKSHVLTAALPPALVAALLLGAPSAEAAGPPVTGTVFRDYDSDGARDALDPGESGVQLVAYDTAGVSRRAVSGADGSYSIDVSGLSGTRFRVEMGALPDFLRSSRHGEDHVGDVRFVDAGGTADFGVINPAEYCSAAAELMTTCFQGGTAAANGPAIVAFPQDAGTTSTTSNTGVAASSRGEGMASHDNLTFDDVVGPVRGLAWQRSTRTVFAGAYAKRHTAYPGGPDDAGPDKIWAVPRDGGAPYVFFEQDAGADDHDYPNLIVDTAFWDRVGKTAWGDVDTSVDEDTVYAVNMFDRLVYAVPASGTPPQGGAATTIDLAPAVTPICGEDWVPGGVKAKDDAVYLTATCTAETSQQTADLRGIVLRVTSGGAPTVVADFPLGYDRDWVSRSGATQAPAEWNPWSTTQRTVLPSVFGQAYYPQPWLTDLEIDEGGRMVVGVTDRAGDQYGNDKAAAGSAEGVAAGDTVRLDPEGDGTWSAGANAGEVLGSEDYPLASATHAEITLGHLALRLGSGQVVANAFDPPPVGGVVNNTDGSQLYPQSFRSGGLVWMDTTTGDRARSYLLYGLDDQNTFGKAAGIGDIEYLCDAAPLEVGDYVWRDTDGDGVQDPDEAPIAGVTVRLYDADGNVVATATTDPDGRYYFPAQPNTDYTIRLDNPADYTAGGPLEGLAVTLADGGTDDQADSDATPAGGFPRIPVTTGGPGATDHTRDVGFTPGYSLGNQLWIDADGDGLADDGEPPVVGATVALLDADGEPVLGPDGEPLTSTTDANGLYLFSGLPPGDYVVSVLAANFAAGEPLAGYGSSEPTVADPDTDVDGDDNGAPSGDGSVRSGVVTLGGATPEPTAEDPANDPDTADPRSNLTVDFGFVSGYSLGNQVWLDTDGDGRIDDGEAPVEGVTVALLRPDGTPVTGPDGQPLTTTTDADGLYLFTGLPAGDYVVSVLADNFAAAGPLAGLLSSGPTSADPDDDVDGNDDGTPSGDGSVRSGVVTLGGATPEPTGEDPANDPDTADARSNLTVDFGFVQTYSLGNQLWLDTDRDGRIDDGEALLAGVTVELLRPDGTPVTGSDGQPLTTTTDADGLYLFTGLPPGEYVVSVPASSFLDGGPLDGLISSPGAGRDDGTDGDDNGAPAAGGTVRTGVIVLGSTEPTGEDPANDPDTPDVRSDLTIDLGFTPRLSDLAVGKSLEGTVVSGALATYVLTVTNRGPDATASAAVVGDTFPSGLTPVSAAGNGWTCEVDGQDVRCSHPGSLAVGASSAVSVRARVTAQAGDSLTNRAEVVLVDAPPETSPDPGEDRPDTVDPVGDNDTDEVRTTVAAATPPLAQTGAAHLVGLLLLGGGLLLLGALLRVTSYRRRAGLR